MENFLTKQIIQKEKEKVNYPDKIFINGNYQNSISGKTFDNISPIDGKLINKINFSQKEDVELAVKSARDSFETGVWSRSDPSHRKKVLLRFAELLDKNRLELSLLDTIDMGKTINDTYNSDLPASIDNIRWYAEIVDKIYDDI